MRLPFLGSDRTGFVRGPLLGHQEVLCEDTHGSSERWVERVDGVAPMTRHGQDLAPAPHRGSGRPK
jgi:hypothetical protein